jgi:ABC-type glycerol-3-phosphate transport system substrate-binding protein
MTDTRGSGSISRGRFLKRAGIVGAAAAGTALPGALTAGQAHAAASFSGNQLNVTYWPNVAHVAYLKKVFSGFGAAHGLTVNYIQLPAAFGDVVQKMTTYLSSGYTGIDVLWLDDFMTGTFSTAGWLEPLENIVSKEAQNAVAPATIKLSTYNGHLYRLPGNAGDVIFFYRKDLFAKAGLSVPRTWDDVVKAGKALTKGNQYGLGFAGKSGNTELFNEMSYWMGQANADPLHLRTPGAQQTLKFVWDMLNTWKIMPPETTAADYTSLSAAFQGGRFAMWPVWDGFVGAFEANTKFWNNGQAVAIALPPRGPANNKTITAAWGWSISKFAPNKDMAAKFIEFAAGAQPETWLTYTGSAPARLSVLSSSEVQNNLPSAKYLDTYARENILHRRLITGQAQRISDAFEAVINEYLNKRIDLKTATDQAQQRIDDIQANA